MPDQCRRTDRPVSSFVCLITQKTEDFSLILRIEEEDERKVGRLE